MHSSSVVFPAPDGPKTIAMPGLTLALTSSSKADCESNRLRTRKFNVLERWESPAAESK
jgi:hypothetical protein